MPGPSSSTETIRLRREDTAVTEMVLPKRTAFVTRFITARLKALRRIVAKK
jgi:hypothetical protein